MTVPVATAPRPLRSPVVPLATAGAAAAGCVALAVWNPSDDGTPLCPTKAALGIDCPFCGGLRSVAAMTRGNPVLSADHNVFLVALAPFVVLWWVAWLAASFKGRPAPVSPLRNRAVAIGLGVVALAFTIVRNVQPGEWGTWLASGAY